MTSKRKKIMDPLEYAEQIAYSSKKVLQFSYDMAVKYKDVPGVYVECGVAAGAQVIAMAAGAPNKTIYALDSFEGIPLPSNKDNQMPGVKFLTDEEQKALPNPGEQVLESSGATSVSMENFVDHLFNSEIKNTNRIYIINGWFEKTLPTFDCPPISVLRLDGDLYNSTYVCLKYLYPKVIEGGLCVVDDWALPGCKQAVLDYFNSIDKPLFIHHQVDFIEDENSTVAYWTK